MSESNAGPNGEWRADPFGRFELRRFLFGRPTSLVFNGSSVSYDQIDTWLTAPPPPPPPAAAAPPPPPPAAAAPSASTASACSRGATSSTASATPARCRALTSACSHGPGGSGRPSGYSTGESEPTRSDEVVCSTSRLGLADRCHRYRGDCGPARPSLERFLDGQSDTDFDSRISEPRCRLAEEPDIKFRPTDDGKCGRFAVRPADGPIAPACTRGATVSRNSRHRCGSDDDASRESTPTSRGRQGEGVGKAEDSG